MEKRYLLPLVALVEAMKASPETVELQTHLSLPGVKGPCCAHVILRQGQVYACSITTRSGVVLRQHQEAYKIVEQRGDLEWILSPSPLSSPQAAQPNAATAASKRTPPVRRSDPSAETLNRLAYPYRRVLLLVDGKRSVEEIARLASKTPQEVMDILKALGHLIQ